MTYQTGRGPNLTPLWTIIGLNLLLFAATEIIQLIDTNLFNEFLYYLGLIPAVVLEHPWTLVTSMFLHGGFGHILANMFTLFFFGRYLSILVGGKRFLLVYFAGGIAGGILYVLIAILLAYPLSVAIGASGAVFAIGGALAVLRPRMRVFIFPIPVPLPLWLAVGGGFLVISFFPGVAWEAHLGGLLVGLAAGYVFRKRERAIF